jgi:hypothetical protein
LEDIVVAKTSLGRVAYLLVLVGGILMILLSVLSFLGMAFMPFGVLGLGLFASFGAILGIILGIVAIFGSKHVTELLWAIILIVVGLVGGGIGGLLVLVGGIIGLLSKHIH